MLSSPQMLLKVFYIRQEIISETSNLERRSPVGFIAVMAPETNVLSTRLADLYFMVRDNHHPGRAILQYEIRIIF
jgi:hypothetical protein